jgi:membrane protein
VLSPRAKGILRHPGAFAWQTLKAFRANRGMLLAGAVAYYAMLSVVPLLIFAVVALSHLVDQSELLQTVSLYIERLFPGRSGPMVEQIVTFFAYRQVVGWVLIATMLFFSTLAFSVLENAMSVIFVHRFAEKRRHFMVKALLPFCFVLVLGIGLLVITVVSSALLALGSESVRLLGTTWSFAGVTRLLIYLVGFAAEALILSAIYYVMPVGRISVRHALIGGTIAALLWEILRHGLVWYFANLSQVGVLYGSLATSIVLLVSFEIAAVVLLFGAQVISEYERVEEPESG